MLGHLESYDQDIQTGVIKVEDKFFEFHIDNWTSEVPPKAGDDVDFLEEDGEISDVSLVGAYMKNTDPVKRRYVAAFLALFFGSLGFHRFYLGSYAVGIVQLILTVLSVGPGLVWGFMEAVLLFTGHFKRDSVGRYLK